MSGVYIFQIKNWKSMMNMNILTGTMDQTESGLSWEIQNIWLLSGNGLFLKEPNTSMAKELHRVSQ